MDGKQKSRNRREFIKDSIRTVLSLFLGGTVGFAANKLRARNTVWQLDPLKCVQCDRCATNCVLDLSAVKCVHAHDMCGHCNLCGGYHRPGAKVQDTAAENQLCPSGAIERKFIEEPYYSYTIIEEKCIGCAKCVKGCDSFGNSSLYLQVRHDRCLNCNECSIAITCPPGAFERVPSDKAYILKGKQANTWIAK
jgi:electron transport complex protein RnfB